MIKKIFSSLLLVIFITNSCNLTFASNYVDSITSEINFSKSKIKKFKDGNKYVIQLSKVEKYINGINDTALLNKIKDKVDVKKNKIIPSVLGGNSSNDLTYELLNYIGLIIEQRLNKLSDEEKDKAISLLNNPDLTDAEIKKVEDEIIKLQLNLLDSSKTFLDKLISDLQKSLNVEESGNLKINVEGSGAMFGNAKGELNITDYKSKTSNFDSEFKSQVDLLIDSSIKGMPALKTQFSSFINFVMKDENYYLLLEKLQYSGIDNEEVNSYLEKLKELAKNNEYLKFEDKESTRYLNLIQNIDLNSIYSKTNKILLNPMLKPYKKVGDKYLLLPTKDFCNVIKGIDYKINGKGSGSCSENEYNNMIKETMRNGNLYIIVDGSDKHFGYDLIDKQSTGYIKIYFSDKKIEKVLARAEETQSKNMGGYAELIFINGQKLDIVFDVKSENIFLSFKSVLSSVNKFSKIDYTGNFTDDFTSSFKLENKKFNGSFSSVLKNYNYDYNAGNSTYEKSGELKGDLSGELDSNNSITFFDININGNQSKDKYDYDWETGKSTSKKVDSVFKMNYILKNESINGNITYTEDNIELFYVKSTGKYKKEYFELNNIINLVNSTTNNAKVTGNLNTKFTGNLNKNNLNIYFDVNYPSYGYIKFNLTSDYEKTQTNNINIQAPTKYKTIDEVFPKNNSSNYDNEFFQ